MRTYVTPLGYDSRRVTRPVLSRGLDDDDEVVLLRPATETDDTRAREAVSDVERLLTEIEPDVSTTTEHITHGDLQSAVLECSDVIHAARGEVIVSLGGGARDVLLPLTIAALVDVARIQAILFFSDIDGTVRDWHLPDLTAEIPSRTRETLAAIAQLGDWVSLSDLAERTGHSKSTVTRHVSQLAENGVIDVKKDGKTKHGRISFTGRLLLRARQSEDDTNSAT